MDIPVSEAKRRLLDLVRRAERGEEVVLTRHGKPAVRLSPAVPRPTAAEKAALLDALEGSAKGEFGPDAARSQDWLYDEFGLPA